MAGYLPPFPPHMLSPNPTRDHFCPLKWAFYHGLQGRLLPRHSDLSRRIWILFKAVKWCASEISTWKQKGNKMTPCCPVEEDLGTLQSSGILQTRLMWRAFVLLRARHSISQGFVLLPKKCPERNDFRVIAGPPHLHILLYFLLFQLSTAFRQRLPIKYIVGAVSISVVPPALGACN